MFFTKSRKNASSSDLFGRDANEKRLVRLLSQTMVSVTKVRELMPYLLCDDHIAGQVIDDKGIYRIYPGGYFRFYDPDSDTMYLSSFKLPAQYQMYRVFGNKFPYIQWSVPRINALYISNKVNERICKELEDEKRPSNPTPTLNPTPTPTPTLNPHVYRAPDARPPLVCDISPGYSIR